jgi:ribosome-associated protein
VSDDVLVVAPGVRVPRSELQVRFSASGGPGGQHANKAATRVELTFDVAASSALLPVQRERVIAKLGEQVRVVVDEERSQARNRTIAEERFVARLAGALRVERPRRDTKPTKGAKERRLQAKRQRSQTKASRRRPPAD